MSLKLESGEVQRFGGLVNYRAVSNVLLFVVSYDKQQVCASLSIICCLDDVALKTPTK